MKARQAPRRPPRFGAASDGLPVPAAASGTMADAGPAVRPTADTNEALGAAWREALSLADAGRLAAAARTLDACLQRQPDCADAHALRGELHLATDELEAALPCLQKALCLQPAHRAALASMIALARRRGDLAEVDNWRGRLERAQAERARARAPSTASRRSPAAIHQALPG